jgi:putative nucleotidyltransferase with HDIG domain
MKRILFVDDESEFLDGIRRLLRTQRERWEMHFAIGGEAALLACETTSFDVVVTDMRMPGMDGATLLGHIRDRYPGAARLVLSGYSEPALAARAAPVAYRSMSKPCVNDELRSTIERVCVLQDLLCTPELRQVIGSIGELPSLSSTYLALARAVQDPGTHIAEIASIIEQDAAMSAKVLQLSNSAFFGLAQRVTSLQSAVSFLGTSTIRNLALVSDTFRLLRPDARIPVGFFEALQLHGHRTAIVAGALPIVRKDRETTIVAALLHDIGRLVLASKAPDLFCKVAQHTMEQNCAEFEAEKILFGISHAEIGAYLLGLWGIDPAVIEAIAHHHEPTRIPHDGLDCSAAVYIADLLADSVVSHSDAASGESPFAALSEKDHVHLEKLGLLVRLQAFTHLANEALQSPNV